MRSASIIFIFFCLISTSFVSNGQVPQWVFNKVGSDKGLSNNYINTIVQDHRGYIWIGTNEGLNCFDGYECKVYLNETGNPHSLPDNKINILFEDSEHNLWIGTEFKGLCLYDSINDNFG